jgi:polyribonucleotide nucleotidyltransferase
MEETGIQEGDELEVKLLEIDPKTGKFKLSRRVLLEKPEGYEERPARPRRERPERAERGDRRPRRREE